MQEQGKGMGCSECLYPNLLFAYVFHYVGLVHSFWLWSFAMKNKLKSFWRCVKWIFNVCFATSLHKNMSEEEWREFQISQARYLRVWILLFTIAVCVGLWQTHHLGTENKKRTAENRALTADRLADIQRSRVHSCRETYSVLLKLIEASVQGQHLTPKRQKRIDQFRDIADPAKCVSQTKPVDKGKK